MASPKPKTSAASRRIKTIDSRWESVLIEWATHDVADLHGTTPFPFVRLEGDTKIKQKTFFDTRSIKGLGAGGVFTPPADILAKTQMAPVQIAIPLPSPKSPPSTTDQLRVGKNATHRQIEQGVQKLSMPIQAKVCTKIFQWIRIEVTTKGPPPTSQKGVIPDLKLWAFLQPANIGGNNSCHAADNRECLDDFPRSGWAEYWIPTGGTRCHRKDWENGVGADREIPASQWSVEQLGPNRFVYKIRVEIRNERTAGDVARGKKQGGASRPDSDFEAGCWLKVWVRDSGVEWGMEPSDDETNILPERMDEMDPSRGISMEGGKFRKLASHAFLRDRLFVGPEDPEKIHQAAPLYAVVFHERAMELLEELEAMLKPADSKAGAEIIAAALAAVVAGIVAKGLQLGLKQWKTTPKSPPAHLPAGVKWPEDFNKDKARTLIQLLETLDLANILAAYACGGLEPMSPLQAVAKAGANNKGMFLLWSKLYSALWDLSLVDGPTEYAEFCMKRALAREELLEQRIDFSMSEVAANKARAGREKELAEERNKALEAARKKKGIGLGRVARGATKASFSLDGGKISLSVPAFDWTKSQRFPKPLGAPLPMPGVPLVWSFDLTATAELKLVITLEPGDETKDWMVSFRIVGEGTLKGSLGLRALWSGLWDGEQAAKNSALNGDKKASQDQLRAEHEAARAETRRLQEQAPTEVPTSFAFFRILKQLNDFTAFDMEVVAELAAKASLGFSYRWNPSTGASDWSFLGGEANGYGQSMSLENCMATLGVSIAARAHISVVKADYPILELPGLASADALTLRLSADGKVLGKAYDAKDLAYNWGKGELDNRIWRKGEKAPLIWGQPATFRLGYKDLFQPEVTWSLRQTASETDTSIGDLPQEAISYIQPDGHTIMEALLHLTCRKIPREAFQTAAGTWTCSTKTVESEVGVVGDALGVVVGLANRVLGREEVDDPNLGLSAAGQFLTNLTTSEAPTEVFLHASFLGNTFSKSDPLTLAPPRLQTCKLVAEPGLLKIHVQLENFLDDVLWVQMREYSHGKSSRILNQGREPWKLVLIESGSKYRESGREGLLRIPLHQLEFPTETENVWEVYPWISVVPHVCGTLNRHLAPRNDMDTERLIRVRTN
ncbi:MAG: hypothetical protein H6686_02890 [Fibrobacteria bacterium]|nr:hypothetical protein [Fibrobacteria bacterium]